MMDRVDAKGEQAGSNFEILPKVRQFELQNPNLPEELGLVLDKIVLEEDLKRKEVFVNETRQVDLSPTIDELVDKESAVFVRRRLQDALNYYGDKNEYEVTLMPVGGAFDGLTIVTSNLGNSDIQSYTAYFKIGGANFPVQISKLEDGTYNFYEDPLATSSSSDFVRYYGRVRSLSGELTRMISGVEEHSDPFSVTNEAMNKRKEVFVVLEKALKTNPLTRELLSDQYTAKTRHRLATKNEFDEFSKKISSGELKFPDSVVENPAEDVIVINTIENDVTFTDQKLQVMKVVCPVIDKKTGDAIGYGFTILKFDHNGDLTYGTWKQGLDLT